MLSANNLHSTLYQIFFTFDIFVIKDSELPRPQRTMQLRRMLLGSQIQKDLIVYTPDEVAKQWIVKGGHDLGTAKINYVHIPEYLDTVTFHCQ